MTFLLYMKATKNIKALLPSNETNRLAALKAYHILDTGTEQCYDDITTLAAHICEVPIVMISLVGSVHSAWRRRKPSGNKRSRQPKPPARQFENMLLPGHA